MKKIVLVILVLSLLTGGVVPVFAYHSEGSDIVEPLNNNRYRRVIERNLVSTGSRQITEESLASRDKTVYAITETLNNFGPIGQSLGYTIMAGDYFYGRRETGTMYTTVIEEKWYQEHRLTGARHLEATYYEFSSWISGSTYSNRFRMR